MKLFIRPRAGSLAPHIALYEAEARFSVDIVDTQTKKTSGGEDYLSLNRMGYVPTLQLDNGICITEGPAILMFIADSFPASRLAPRPGTVARAHMSGFLNFVAAEIHKSFSPFFCKSAPFFRGTGSGTEETGPQTGSYGRGVFRWAGLSHG